MHIPDGFISMPINVGAAVVSASACAAALARTRATMGEKQVPLVGLTSSFIFAAQMLNFPVAMGTSGHFLGALLAAALLGPLESCLILAVVLAIQCLFFADGGLLVLGTNVLNMGVVGGMGGWLVLVGLRAILPRGRRRSLGLSPWLRGPVSCWRPRPARRSWCSRAWNPRVMCFRPCWACMPSLASVKA